MRTPTLPSSTSTALVFGVPTKRASSLGRMRATPTMWAGVVLAVAGCGGSADISHSTAPGTCYTNLSAPAPGSGSGVVTIDPASHFQTMQGFGTTERLFDDPHVTNTFDPATQRAAAIPPAADQAKI